ncbi:hypothetical protein 9 [Wuhan heteroptera virus 3]|uniref:hypothetical protein 9 n=1 Tax=Wuhan heteroptera virus 3 TaxID=1923703 RepID=UPI00090AD3EA|nr:hypothetical protein 9 [Wuhan heteroptera virus 3]APG79076.1 hypothetical protein 9 [Wuhan heteroptera virus 3]APG79212.1 hypothetical protein 9 [Wuhan heteroptera virus 3]
MTTKTNLTSTARKQKQANKLHPGSIYKLLSTDYTTNPKPLDAPSSSSSCDSNEQLIDFHPPSYELDPTSIVVLNNEYAQIIDKVESFKSPNIPNILSVVDDASASSELCYPLAHVYHKDDHINHRTNQDINVLVRQRDACIDYNGVNVTFTKAALINLMCTVPIEPLFKSKNSEKKLDEWIDEFDVRMDSVFTPRPIQPLKLNYENGNLNDYLKSLLFTTNSSEAALIAEQICGRCLQVLEGRADIDVNGNCHLLSKRLYNLNPLQRLTINSTTKQTCYWLLYLLDPLQRTSLGIEVPCHKRDEALRRLLSTCTNARGEQFECHYTHFTGINNSGGQVSVTREDYISIIRDMNIFNLLRNNPMEFNITEVNHNKLLIYHYFLLALGEGKTASESNANIFTFKLPHDLDKNVRSTYNGNLVSNSFIYSLALILCYMFQNSYELYNIWTVPNNVENPRFNSNQNIAGFKLVM